MRQSSYYSLHPEEGIEEVAQQPSRNARLEGALERQHHPRDESFNLTTYLPYLINRTGVQVAGAFSREIEQHGITLQMWRVLAALWQGGERKSADLIVDTSIEQSTLSRLVTTMEQRGMLTRRRSNHDARAVVVALTEEGRRVTKELIPYALRNERIALRGFSREEIDILLGMLTRIYDNAADLKL